ncbi:hypothetical protein B0O99DRAFT_643911 [Bisporella sp. PMI_857]|nr:hypothetical protein B0O99DRAFT_643911 [Bisporella sp. PMI_857]
MQRSENSTSRLHRVTFLFSSLGSLATDAAARCHNILENLNTSICGALVFLPKALAVPVPEPGYFLLEPPESSYLDFQPTPSNDSNVIADSKYFSDRSPVQQLFEIRVIIDAAGDNVPPRERATVNIPTRGINLYNTHNSSAGAPIRAPVARRRG